MVTITANDTPMFVLRAVADLAEVRDEDGNLLGHFVPDGLAEKRRLYEAAKLTINEEEVQPRLADKAPGYSFKEVLEHLLSVTKDEEGRALLLPLIRQREDEEILEGLRALLDSEPSRSQLASLVRQQAEQPTCVTP